MKSTQSVADERTEAQLDKMLADTFPASDPPQLPSIAAGPVEQTVALGDQGSVTLHLAGESPRLQLFLGPNGLALGVAEIDMRIATLRNARESLQTGSPRSG